MKSRSAPSILVKGGEIELDTIDSQGREHTIVVPKGYGWVHDPSGRDIEDCSLYVGPITTTNDRVEKLPKYAAQYFGNDYEAKLAYVDIPSGTWKSLGHAAAILYFRPGTEHAADWFHEFSKPVPLFKQGRWWKLKLPRNCEVTWRGIVTP